MADKKFDIGQGLGDLSSILHNQGVSDLSWLAVDEETYRASEALPKQNLDIIPELQKALSEDDDGVPHLIPLRPHTIVNSGKSESPPVLKKDYAAPIRNRVAAMTMMGMAPEAIQVRLALEFAPEDIAQAEESIQSVLDERGLLGNVYVDAAHFPRAASDPKVRDFVKKYAKDALFVVGGCQGTNGCNCHETGMCTTFGSKRVVSSVPYGLSLASYLAPRLASEKRPLDMSGEDVSELAPSEWKKRIQASFLLSAIAQRDGGVRTVHQQAKVQSTPVTKEDVQSFIQRKQASSGVDPMPSVAYAKYARRMMAGHDDRNFLVASTDPELQKLAGEFGILGHTYVDADVLGGCRPTLALVRERKLSPDFVIRRSASCSMCMGTEDGACAALCGAGATIAHALPEMDRKLVGKALVRAASDGRIQREDAVRAAKKVPVEGNWRKLVAAVNLHKEVHAEAPAEYAGAVVRAHHILPGSNVAAEMDPEEVRRSISHLMNTGLSGKALQAAILQRYSREDLVQVPEVGRRAAIDDGVQGHYFIDPTAYRDYGKGCSDGAKQFRKRGANYVLASNSCTGCSLQTAPGWCSKYAKGLIRQVPTQVREHVASSRRQLPVVQTLPVENPVERYELSSELTVDIKGSKVPSLDISLPTGKIDT